MQQVPVSDTSDTGLTDNFDSQDLSVEPCLYTERPEAAELTQAYMSAERLLPVLQLLPDTLKVPLHTDRRLPDYTVPLTPAVLQAQFCLLPSAELQAPAVQLMPAVLLTPAVPAGIAEHLHMHLLLLRYIICYLEIHLMPWLPEA